MWNKSVMPRLDGRLAIVTGVGGLGYEAALGLAEGGANVVLAGRNPAKGEMSRQRILKVVPSADVRFETLDLASMASIHKFADRVAGGGINVDTLVNNAGVMAPPIRRETADGFELQFGTNYLGHFALTLRLLPILLRAQAPRVINVSSIVHKQGNIDFDNLQARRAYRPRQAYAQSKLAMLMFAFELERRARASGSRLMSIAVHPGIARTDLFTNGPGTTGLGSHAARMILPLVSHSAADGALPLLFAATAREARGGGYYGPTRFFEMNGPVGDANVAAQARDAEITKRLWTISEEITGLTSPI